MPRKEDAAGAVAVSFLRFEQRMNFTKDKIWTISSM